MRTIFETPKTSLIIILNNLNRKQRIQKIIRPINQRPTFWVTFSRLLQPIRGYNFLGDTNTTESIQVRYLSGRYMVDTYLVSWSRYRIDTGSIPADTGSIPDRYRIDTGLILTQYQIDARSILARYWLDTRSIPAGYRLDTGSISTGSIPAQYRLDNG